MKHIKWSSKEKLRIVLEGIKGQVPLRGTLRAKRSHSGSILQVARQTIKEGEKAFECGGVIARHATG